MVPIGCKFLDAEDGASEDNSYSEATVSPAPPNKAKQHNTALEIILVRKLNGCLEFIGK
jgi:hypothetical protein